MTTKKQKSIIHRDFAHLWGNGCQKITIMKIGIKFSFRLPRFVDIAHPYKTNNVAYDMIHCFKPIWDMQLIQDKKIQWAYYHFVGWDKQIFTPENPKIVRDGNLNSKIEEIRQVLVRIRESYTKQE